MIRIRYETGLRKRTQPVRPLPIPEWSHLAAQCAQLQAHSIFDYGQKRIAPFRMRDANLISLEDLYAYDLVELIAWDEHPRTRKLVRIRSVDLSLSAAICLQTIGVLPKCFFPLLVAEDLLGTSAKSASSHRDLELAEFQAWIECGGLALHEKNCLVSHEGSNVGGNLSQNIIPVDRGRNIGIPCADSPR